jgi:hypothetical protein
MSVSMISCTGAAAGAAAAAATKAPTCSAENSMT